MPLSERLISVAEVKVCQLFPGDLPENLKGWRQRRGREVEVGFTGRAFCLVLSCGLLAPEIVKLPQSCLSN